MSFCWSGLVIANLFVVKLKVQVKGSKTGPGADPTFTVPATFANFSNASLCEPWEKVQWKVRKSTTSAGQTCIYNIFIIQQRSMKNVFHPILSICVVDRNLELWGVEFDLMKCLWFKDCHKNVANFIVRFEGFLEFILLKVKLEDFLEYLRYHSSFWRMTIMSFKAVFWITLKEYLL